MALNLRLRRLTTRLAPRTSIMKCVDFWPTRFAFAKNRRPSLPRRGSQAFSRSLQATLAAWRGCLLDAYLHRESASWYVREGLSSSEDCLSSSLAGDKTEVAPQVCVKRLVLTIKFVGHRLPGANDQHV